MFSHSLLKVVPKPFLPRWSYRRPTAVVMTLVVIAMMASADTAVAQHYLASGTYDGDDSIDRAIAGVGFQPDLVIVKGDMGQYAYCRTATMPEGWSKSLGESKSLEEFRIRSLDADGFTVGDDDAVNKSGETYHWIAMKETPGLVEVGSYWGAGGFNDRIDVPGIYPQAVLVLAKESQYVRFRTIDMDFNQCGYLVDKALENNGMTGFWPDYFEIDSHDSVNQLFRQFHYIVFGQGAEALTTGWYRGNGNDNRNITGVGFEPEYVMIKTDRSDDGVHRPAEPDLGTDALHFDNTANLGDAIQRLLPDGFQVGRNNRVNPGGGEDVYWVAFANGDPEADLALTLDADDVAPDIGETVTFTVDLTNTGPDDTSGVIVQAVLPPGLTFISATPSAGTYDDPTSEWRIEDLPDAANATLTVLASVDASAAGQSLVTTASVLTADTIDPDFANNDASVVIDVVAADLLLQKVVDNSNPDVGDTIRYTVTVTNLGPSDATGVEITDLLPAGLTFQTAEPTFGDYDDVTGLWTVGDLAHTDNVGLVLTATVDAGLSGSIITNTAEITAVDQFDTEPANNLAEAALVVTSADLVLNKNVDITAPAEGETITYTISLGNAGPAEATGIAVIDQLPAGVTFVSADPSVGSYDDGSGLWRLDALPNMGFATLLIVATVDAGTAGTIITNTGTIFEVDQGDPVAANNTAHVSITVASTDLRLEMAVDEDAPNEGDTLQYTVTIFNDGPMDATGVQVTDLLPSGLTFVSANHPLGTYNDGTGLWDLGDLANGDDTYLQISATVDNGTVGQTFVNTATITAVDQPDPVPDNDSASVDVAVAGTDMQLTMLVNDAAPDVGDNVVFSLTLTNAGPNPVTMVEVTDVLPEGLTFVSATASTGAYNEWTSIWSTGAMAVSGVYTLDLTASVDAGYGGSVITNTAAISATDVTDFDPSNDTASIDISVTSADLQVTNIADIGSPDVGDTVVYTITLENAGPSPASGVLINAAVPVGTSFVQATTGHGSYDEVTGEWTVDDLVAGGIATLDLSVVVAAGTGGTIVVGTAAVASADQSDPNPTNNSDGANIVVRAADLSVSKDVDQALVAEDVSVTFTVTVANAGPDSALAVVVADQLPLGLVYESDTPSQGSYDSGTGIWQVGDLADGASANLSLQARTATGSGGSIITNTAIATTPGREDPVPANNSDNADVGVLNIMPSSSLNIWPIVGAATDVNPGSSFHRVLSFALTNAGGEPDTVRSLTLTNLTNGAQGATTADLDAEWQSLSIRRDFEIADIHSHDMLPATALLADGTAVFAGLNWAVAPGDTIEVQINSGASLHARDTSELVLGIADPSDLETARPVRYDEDWPLISGHVLRVDGFVAAQAPLQQVPASVLAVGSQHNMALIVDLPSNGYLADILYGLTLVNHGSAQPGSDIAVMEAWGDDGDGIFSSLTDELLGEVVYSGELWQLTGLSTEIPVGGRRLYFTVDIAETAQPARDIRLGLPIEHGTAVDMSSGNDGPIDMEIENTAALGISVTDRVILTADNIQSGPTNPGSNNVKLLSANFINTYASDQVLQSLTVLNASTGDAGATTAELDATFTKVNLRLDGDFDGELDDLVTDPALGSGAFVDGMITFSGLNLTLPTTGPVRLFVAADVDLTAAADGDVLSAVIAEPDHVWIPGATTAASWPLDSESPWTVNGMVAEQIVLNDVPVTTLGPGDGPALALDLIVPPNGYQADELLALTVVNVGTATEDDLALVELWKDGGDGLFDGGAGDDTSLSELNWDQGGLSSLLLNRPVAADGLRLFVAVTIADPPTDGSTIRLAIPTDGIQMASGNSGPISGQVVENGTTVLSTSALFSSLSFVNAASSVGYPGQIQLTVRNNGSERVVDIEPDLTTVSGTASLSLEAPTPAILDLDVGSEAVFTWNYTATEAGQIVLEGSAFGQGETTSLNHESAPMPTPEHQVFSPVPRLDVYPTINLPASITRGVADVVPLTLTLVNPGTENTAEARLDSLRLRLAESIDGNPIVPADLFTRVQVGEGTNIYYVSTDLPTSGDEITLEFSPPVIVTGNEPVTLGVKLDLDLNTTVPSFLLAIDSQEFFSAADIVNQQPVPVAVGDGDFPIMTNRADLVSPAGSLTIGLVAGSPHETSLGQADVLLAELALGNTSSDEFSSPILVNGLAFTFADAAGTTLSDPSVCFQQFRVESAYQQHFIGLPQMADSLAVLAFATPVLVPANANLTLELIADISAESRLGTVTPVLGDVDHIDAEDANDGSAIPVTLLTAPEGATLNILGLVSPIPVVGNGLLPNASPQGVHDAPALQVRLAHADPVGSAAVICDSLILHVTNAQRQPVDPAIYLDRIRVLNGTVSVGTVVDPSDPGGTVAIDLADPVLEAENELDLVIQLDFRNDCPTASFEVTLPASGIIARNSVSGERLEIDTGSSAWPLSSGVTQLYVPAEELLVGAVSLMPPLLAPYGEPYPVLLLNLRNNASAQGGVVLVDELTLGQPAGKAAGQELGQFVVTVQAMVGGEVRATTGDIATDATGVTLSFAESLSVPAAGDLDVEIRVLIRDEAPPGELVLVLDETGLAARPPGGTAPDIRVLAASGHSFPFVTEQGTVSAASLGASYINFPNPFAAGSEATTFAYALPVDGRVTLRIMTPHGESVITLLENEPRPAGLQQTDTWDGVNGRGVTVRNGVYIAEISVEFDDGTRQRELRKVAVVR